MAMDAFLDQLSEAKETDIPDAILPLQTLNSDDQYVWEFVRSFIFSQYILKRGHRYGETVPGATDSREGEPAFYLRIEEAEDEDDDPITTLYFYTGEKGEDWIEVSTGSGSGSGNGTSADLPPIATDEEMEDGTLTTLRQMSPHLIQLAIEALGISVTHGNGISITGDGVEKTIAVENPVTEDQIGKLDGIEAEATADQTPDEIRDALHGLTDEERLDFDDLKGTPPAATELTREQIIDGDSEEFGEISGERFRQAFDEHAPDILEPTEIEDETSTEEGLLSGERFKEGFDHHLENADIDEHVSGNPFTQEDEDKLDNIEAGAEVNVKSDWDETSGDAEILNKPNIPEGGDDNVQADWDEQDTADHAYIQNKPDTITQAQSDKLAGVEDDATEDQTPEEIATAMEGRIRDEHIAVDLSDAEKQEFRHRIDAEEEGAVGGGGGGFATEDVGSATGLNVTNNKQFVATGITIPTDVEWLLVNFDLTSDFMIAEWHHIFITDLTDLTASTAGTNPVDNSVDDDYIIITNFELAGNHEVTLGRTTANELLIGSYGSASFPSLDILVKKILESGNGGGGGGSGEDTDITIERDADSVDVQSSTGGDGTIPAADTDNAGVLTADQFDKLESVEENANVFTDDERSKLDSVPDDITEPLLIFARSTTEPHHPTGAVSDTGVLSLDGEWDRFIPLAVGGSRSGTISLRSNNENPTGVARHGGETYVANDGPTTNDKRFFIYNDSGLPIALYNLHGDNEDPQGITITPDGKVFIPDGAGEEFFQYTTAGVYVSRHSFPSGANITGAGSDENYLYFLNSSIRQVYVYFHGGGANPSRNRTLPFTGTHNFRGYTFANGRDYVLNSTGSDHEILVYRNGIRLTSEEQDLDSDNAAARGLGIDGSRFFVADSSDNIIYIYGDEDVNENPLFVAEAYVNLTDNTVTFSEFFQVDVSRFNLYDDVENELDALADDDRFLVVDYSADGRPNRYIDYSDLRDALRTEIEFNLHDDVDTELTSPANDDRMLIADESETGNPQRFIRYQTAKDDIRPSVEGDGSTVVSSPTHINVTGDGATVTVDNEGVRVDIPQGDVAVDDTTIEEDATDGLRVKNGGIDTDQLADDSVNGDKLGDGVVDDTHIHSTISAQGKVNFRAKIESDKVLEGTGISIADSNNQKEISVDNPFTEEDEILLGEVASNSGGHLSHGDLILRSQYASEHFFGDSRRRVQGMTHDGDAPFVIDGTGRINDQDTLVGNDDVYGLATNNQNWYVGSNDGNLVHVYRRNTDETFSQSSPGSTSTVAARSLAIDPDDGTICYQFRLPGSGIEIRSHIISETVGNGQFDPEVTRTISLADINAVLNNNDVESLQSEITINGNVGITAIGASGGFIYIVCSGVYIENQRSSASAVIRAEITGTGSSRDYTLDDDYLQLINVPNGISAIVPVDEGFWVARSYSVLDYREGVINSTDLGDFPDAPVEADDGKVPTYTHADENYQLKYPNPAASFFWFQDQTIRLPVSVDNSHPRLAANDVVIFNGDDADEDFFGGIGTVTIGNLDDESSADPDTDTDRTFIQIHRAGLFHIKVKSLARSDSQPNPTVVVRKITSGTDDILLLHNAGYATGTDVVQNIGHTFTEKADYIALEANDKIYIRFYSLSPENRLVGNLQIERVA